MNFSRASGVLLHPTSLPSDYGIGDLGAQAIKFVDFLYKAVRGANVASLTIPWGGGASAGWIYFCRI